MAIAMHS